MIVVCSDFGLGRAAAFRLEVRSTDSELADGMIKAENHSIRLPYEILARSV